MIGTLNIVLRLFDKAHNVKKMSGAHHATKFYNDFKVLTNQFVKNVDVFLKISGRHHHFLKSSSLNSIATQTLNYGINHIII